MEYNNDTGAVFLDLAKAFNSISHEIFLKKAESSNLSQSTILLFQSFLANRTQCVKLGIDLSDKLTINHGVPQGTMLGPLICVLNVNDFPEKLEGENDVVNSRTAIAEAIFGLLLVFFYFVVTIFVTKI